MKKFLLLILLFAFSLGANAQTFNNPPSMPCDSVPQNCYWDLRNSIFDINNVVKVDGTNMTSVIVYGNSNNATYYHDVSLKDEEDGCIAQNDCSDKNDNYADVLKLFVYYPKHDYSTTTGCKLPVFIFAHAGGFSDCKRLSPTSATATFCTYMASRGFVVYAIEYRTGRALDLKQKTAGVFYNSVFQNTAVYRAAQDVRGAIRYIIYRELHEGTGDINDPFRIDLNNVFLGGASAGSVAMLSASYFYETSGQSMLNAVFPVQNDVITNVLGNINIDFYLGNDNLNYMQGVKGICNMWGSVNVPTSYFSGTPHPKDFFSSLPYKPPVISFCGKNDKVFDYNFQQVFYSPSGHSKYNSTSFCVNAPYTLEGNANTVDMYNVGSKGFFDLVLQPLGIFSEMYLDCQAGHGLDDPDPLCHTCTQDPNNYFVKPDLDNPGSCKLCGYQSNYGVPTANTSDLTYYYIASRVAVFFQSIMSNNTTGLGKNLFIECENKRHNCSLSDDVGSPCPDNCNGQ